MRNESKAQEKEIDNLSMLLRMCLASMQKHGINPKLRQKAGIYLMKHNRSGILRQKLNDIT